VPKKGSDLTYLLRWTAKPGAVIGDPTACKVFSAGSIKNFAQAVASMMNLTRILAHLLDINTAQKNLTMWKLEKRYINRTRYG
jgi:hypothetical protein